MEKQTKRLLQYMRTHNGATALDGFYKLGIVNIHARLDDLKKQGYFIRKETEKGKNRYGEKVTFYRYFLVE